MRWRFYLPIWSELSCWDAHRSVRWIDPTWTRKSTAKGDGKSGPFPIPPSALLLSWRHDNFLYW